MRLPIPVVLLLILTIPAIGQQPVAPLPAGGTAAWDLASAYRESTPTRERICINGMWRWQPAGNRTEVPSGDWGWFKVPGTWPGITDYMQKDCQTVIAHPAWKTTNLGGLRAAWYQREMTIPASWTGRRIVVAADYVNTLAAVYVDGRAAGEIRFPAGEVDLTSTCKPGTRHLLSIRVIALPLKAVMTSFADTNNAREVAGSVARRGLCGDMWLVSEPRAERITDVRVEPSVRRKELAVSIAAAGLRTDLPYLIRADILDHGTVVHRAVFPRALLRPAVGGRFRLVTRWLPKKLWDIHAAQNQLVARVTLLSPFGKALDEALPVRFGFREMWIDGRDFILNGSRIYLQALPFDNAQVGAAWSTYGAARESMLRLKSFGINFVYTHNYDCEPGSHLSFEEILRAADDTGMLVALTQPHFSAYDWQKPDADRTNGYRHHAEFYVRVAQNHPSVVAYAMSHNATSYDEAKNPDRMDGRVEPRDSWAMNNVRKALRAEAIVRELDATRIVYHHSSGSLGSMYTENFYVNFAPIQELSDWFGTWATQGVKPMFLCEYGVPFSWDWTMYRGWYKGKREWGSAEVPWELSIAEWNAQFVGDRAYKISEREKADLRWEAAQFRAGREGWHRWDYPTPVGSAAFDERNEVFAAYITDNWRAYRTWGVSAFSPWEYEVWWQLRPGVDRKRRELPVDWAHLQRPGYSPDYVDSQYETLATAYQRADWIPSVAARALMRNNRPLLGYIAGKAARFTSKDHNFAAGDMVEKQLIVINNSRETVSCECRWSIALGTTLVGRTTARIGTGDQARNPVRFTIPPGFSPGRYPIKAVFRFSTGETQTDSFTIDVVPPKHNPSLSARIACFDPGGETTAMLQSLGVHATPVIAQSDLSAFDLLIIGKKAITPDGPCPDVRRVRQGLKLIVFEQTAEALERRLGFRVAEYGMRTVFPRVPDHPALALIGPENLRDWNGEAILSSPRLDYTLKPMVGPMVEWCGMQVPHVWRCGCQGNVASVLIEKPASGDFLPLIDGGYSLQYSPLLEYRDGKGMALFCQLDVTGRTVSDPAARRIAINLLEYAAEWKPASRHRVLYSGEDVGRAHLVTCGFVIAQSDSLVPVSGSIMVLGPGNSATDSQVAQWRAWDGKFLALGLDEPALHGLIAADLRTRPAEHISTWFEPPARSSLFAGISPADVHVRDPRSFALVESGPKPLGDGILADAGASVICQVVPWRFDPSKQMNLKRTFRRTSFLLSRLLSNMGADSTTPLLDDMTRPAGPGERRWLDGLYLDSPTDWDDPYRFFGW